MHLSVFSQYGLLSGTGYAPNFTTTDINGNTQPSNIFEKWNLRGLNNNTLHKKCYQYI